MRKQAHVYDAVAPVDLLARYRKKSKRQRTRQNIRVVM